MTDAISGYGTKFEYLATAPSSYAELGELVSVTPPGRTWGTTGATHLQSPDQYEEDILTLKQAGEWQLAFNYEKSDYNAIVDLFELGELQTFRATLPDGSTEGGAGWITAVSPDEIVVDGKIAFQVTLKAQGKQTFAAGA